MMAMLGQWLGLESSGGGRHESASASSPGAAAGASRARGGGGIVIRAEGAKARKAASDDDDASARTAEPTLRKTKSDELLRDFDVMRFLGGVDERLKEQRTLLSRAELDRLSTLHAQASVDECGVLSDIIEHFEMEHDKLRHRLALASPSSAAADAMMAQRNMLVY